MRDRRELVSSLPLVARESCRQKVRVRRAEVLRLRDLGVGDYGIFLV